MQTQNANTCAETGGLCFINFLTSVLRHEERQFLKVFRNHTMLTTPPTFGTSRGVLDLNSSLLVGTRKT